ncbi:NAD(P)-binding domain-containing protein [Streptomyces hirsutus]|uniref:NAD(P)-binding domain-containing protein n=1 Tax=Streptomyces hirsutus TaxID=35620 RepID=A0ABZ1H2K2_9ACTN|nr:NAD(P)-binding domain-containing protein [Streptomyces hirsutus]WSD11601.1 NAD(P)-binding domain-containing protein [Streptomyces hirsutus]WTD22446.1 NAD(P)-binding domain-containing protein [Streptomyces hirsutus]WTD80008.1 NAD(P)-binding domain-containing protein [Streptomyces sp. NBC_01635]
MPHGHEPRGHDLSSDAAAAARQAGVVTAGSVADVVAKAQVVITMLPTGRHLQDAILGDGDRQRHLTPPRLGEHSESVCAWLRELAPTLA